MKLDKWAIPQTKIINAPIKIDKTIFIKFLLKRFFEKYDSGTGWPSFFDYIPNALGFKTDFKLVFPRKEYHCAKCGGHHGHVFKEGPEPTG